MNAWLIRLISLFSTLLIAGTVNAHEMGIALLEVTETSTGHGFVRFKRTKAADGRLAPLDFELQPDCQIVQSGMNNAHPNELIQTASFSCPNNQPLTSVSATGFTRLAPDLTLKITRQGLVENSVLSPAKPQHEIGLPAQNQLMSHYFQTGALHMLEGLDHLLFVAGLFLLWAARKVSKTQLLALVSCFTVGHSLTLALLSVGLLKLPTNAIEALIALSVLYMAVNIVFAKRGQRFKATDYCLVVGFGLLHGAGFSNSISTQGFPAQDLIATLFVFNLGIEAAQLAILLTLIALLRLSAIEPLKSFTSVAHQISVILLGGVALAWTTERILNYV